MRYSPAWCPLHTYYLIYIWPILSSSPWPLPVQESLAPPSFPFTVKSWSISYSLSKLTLPPVSFHWLFPISLKSFSITTLWTGMPCCTAPHHWHHHLCNWSPLELSRAHNKMNEQWWVGSSLSGPLKIPGGGHGNPQIFLSGESHGQRSLAGYSA